MAPLIRVTDATVVRGETVILDSVSLTVNPGERWVVLGPNGAGKTTLLDLLATHSHPTSGQLEILGQPLGLANVFDLRPLIGVVSGRTTALIPESERVRDVVITAGWAVAGRYREQYDSVDLDRCEQLLAFMGVLELAERPFSTLSEGERKRVLIARALFPNPELLLFDEPAAGLDVGAREGLVERLSVIAKDDSAPVQVMITHHVEEIPPGFTHVLLLRKGKALAQGQIEVIMTDELLSEAFDMALTVRRVFSRYWAFAT